MGEVAGSRHYAFHNREIGVGGSFHFFGHHEGDLCIGAASTQCHFRQAQSYNALCFNSELDGINSELDGINPKREQ